MGSMKEMVYCGETDRCIELNIEFDLTVVGKNNRISSISFFRKNHFKTSWVLNEQNDLPKIKSFHSHRNSINVYVREDQGSILLDISDDDFGQDENSEERYSAIMNSMNNMIQDRAGENLSEYNKFIKVVNVRYASIDSLESELNILEMYYFLDEEISTAVFKYKNFVDSNFNYVGSFRKPPFRTYNQRAKSARKTDIDGEGYIDQLTEWQERDEDKFRQISMDASSLGLFDEIKPNRIQGGRYELTIKTGNSRRWTSLADIGFGVSQFLPIIVADHQLNGTSCLAISQPEIHLHPKIQAQFGNYLANEIKRTQKQYIVETHSEYLLNRIRLLLVTGELKPEDVRVLYFENDGVKSTVYDVEFTTKGAVKGAPRGFFDTYEMDVMDIAMHAIG
ncbi:hypothetical protein GCM10027423_59220 [Spirosoma arcticum]